MDDKMLRLEICKQAGFTIDEALFVYKFVTGDDEALTQLKNFHEWKSGRDREAMLAQLEL